MTGKTFDPKSLVDAMLPVLGLTVTQGKIARADDCAFADRGGTRSEASFCSARRSGGTGSGLHSVTVAVLLDGLAQAIAAAVTTGAVQRP